MALPSVGDVGEDGEKGKHGIRDNPLRGFKTLPALPLRVSKIELAQILLMKSFQNPGCSMSFGDLEELK